MRRPEGPPPGPPRSLHRLLCLLLSRNADCEFMLGDLEEDYRWQHQNRGSARALRWYLAQVARCLLHQLSRLSSIVKTDRSKPAKDGPQGLRIGQLLGDLRYSARCLQRQPGFALTALLTLALAIAANTTVFSLVNGLLLRPLPYPEPDRLVHLGQTLPEFENIDLSLPDFEYWRRNSRVFESMAVYDDIRRLFSGDGAAERIEGAAVTWQLFRVLGIEPIRGRTFSGREDRPGADAVVVISHGFWERRLGGDPEATERTILLDGRPYAVIGVMPPGFGFPEVAEFWLPLALDPQNENPLDYGWDAIARLKPGETLESAQTEADLIARRIAAAYPGRKEGLGGEVYPLRAADVGQSQQALMALWASVGLVLLIACANLSNLMLARASSRGRETSLRLALGSGRWAIVRLVLSESLLLTFAGGAAGTLLGLWAKDLILDRIPHQFAYWIRFDFDLRVLAFVIMASLASLLLFGLLPALRTARIDPAAGLCRSSSARNGSGALPIRRVLISAQVALALVLLTSAGLTTRAFLLLAFQDPGFRGDQSLALGLWIPTFKYPDHPQRRQLHDRIMHEIGQLPGIEGLAAASDLPLGGSSQSYFQPQGLSTQSDRLPVAYLTAVSPDYFRILHVPLLQGRSFNPFETSPSQANQRPAQEAVVSQSLAARFWPGEDPLGKQFALGGPEQTTSGSRRWFTIVGVAGDVRQGEMWDSSRMGIYVPFRPGGRSLSLVIRTSGKPLEQAEPIRRRLHQIDPDIPLYRVQLLDELKSRALWMPRLFSQLFTAFGLGALLLAAVGIYGVVAYSVSRRRREIGVRLALGARGSEVVRLMVRRLLMPLCLGLVVGTVSALAATRVLAASLFGISPTDPFIFGLVNLTLAAAALLACYLPARRASQVDPTSVLRSE